MNKRVALITGVTGQDGAYLARLLLEKDYIVHAIKRRSSSFNTGRIEDIYQDPHVADQRLILHYGDMTDSTNLIRVMQEAQPDEVYNLAAMSFVGISWIQPTLTAEFTGVGVTRMLEAVREACPDARFYQASSSEMFGKVLETPQTETTPFYPRSPYAVAKLYAYWITVNYREAYGMFACNGILFNHESPLRGETFVTRKISRAAAAIALGRQDKLYLGNLGAKLDWGHAKDYVRGMWLMLQQDEPEDFVLATGEAVTVREFAEWCFAAAGIALEWRGEGLTEEGICVDTGRSLIAVDPRYFRPTEVELLIGDPSKAHAKLGWRHETNVRDLAAEMTAADLIEMKVAPLGAGA